MAIDRPLIRLRGITKTYARQDEPVLAVNRVSFAVHKGEFVFLCGPSGSGKSTLLTIMGCLLRPDCGSLEIDGTDVAMLPETERTRIRRHQIGFVFQRFNLVRGLNAIQNVALPTVFHGNQSAVRARQLLEQVGLAKQLRVDPSDMSVGQCQRVAIARALVNKPKLVLADEPTASLDSDSGIQSIELLKRVTRSSGSACVVVTHDPRIYRFADRIIRIEKGRLVGDQVRRKRWDGETPPANRKQQHSSRLREGEACRTN